MEYLVLLTANGTHEFSHLSIDWVGSDPPHGLYTGPQAPFLVESNLYREKNATLCSKKQECSYYMRGQPTAATTAGTAFEQGMLIVWGATF